MKKWNFIKKILTLGDLQGFSEQELALAYAGQQVAGREAVYSYNDGNYYDGNYYDASYYDASYYDASYYESGSF